MNVGYIRKPQLNESASTRIRCLDHMANILSRKTSCTHIYVSPVCKSTSPQIKRDYDDNPLAKRLTGVDGTMQDTLKLFSQSGKSIRLCVIEFAGLTDDPNDLQQFLRRSKKQSLITKG
ncbi:hypothetical protein BCR43DRAFT_298147 [Syncephalastrum racemosum]|uniref:Resolvase/invertase-type recombinase catalytic domain-containing protein n=1 Tax=Syncephalastrum racemosum TaxID=13706 RepID=A0A1X2H9I8_SYNRA|nr:hypothetical protein BCR43DRAFT_298147 [Syncephalastrum racemosum]